jgi:Uma2 family endonuclease
MRPMPRVPPFDRPATYDDLVRVPEPMVAEIVDGELHASPRPAVRHSRTASGLGSLLGPPFDRGQNGPGGWWILFEPELHFGANVLVPDLAGWRRSTLPRLPDAAFITQPPDWVCEVLSPSTVALDRAKKLAIYAREGVAHCWLLDPIGRTLEVLWLESRRWVILATHLGDESVRAEPFADIDLPLADLWLEE